MTKIRILVDGYFLGVRSGYGRYIEELCGAINCIGRDIDFFIIVPRDNKSVAHLKYENLNFVKVSKFPFQIWEQLVLPIYSLKLGCDYVHYPYNTASFLSLRARKITTVHDLTFKRQDVERDWKSSIIHAYMRLAFGLGTRRSTHIIAVSKTTQRQLKLVDLESSVVYNTVENFVGQYRHGLNKYDPKPYFIHRGGLAPEHRNTARVIKAFLTSEKIRNRYRLKIFGIPKNREHFGLKSEDPVDLLGSISDKDLADIYFNCTAVIAVSLVEGFCLPILEAFGFNTPVITSNLDPMLEIASDAALIVDPYDVASLQSAMMAIGENVELADELRQKGQRRYQDFSTVIIAEKLLRIYSLSSSSVRSDVNGRTKKQIF